MACCNYTGDCSAVEVSVTHLTEVFLLQWFFTGLGHQEADILVGAGPVEAGITLFPPHTGDVEAARVAHTDGHQITPLAGIQTC